ncbi:protein TolR [Lacimicrobium alkaliphilum]|uniref:Tol-Pal system protein TolR n=2 Tax=Lacimicrobium alkaliphilum TaxID=1526571 RepID=A0A0U2Z645_9ALTE|nr:protein TolR [Lacimicrobium alkaliphilum]ALS97940.1 protein TolR [Lacimicrobium alkaliphilum]GGD75777.1 protein TolR [Lacimicrobium alkaliphilum]
MYERKRRRPVSEINVVPYIDVMLVLLIIFMVTAPLVTQGVKVELPKASAEALSEDSKPPLIASVNADGEYFLNVGESQEEPLTAVDLATLVAAHLQKEPDTPVVVKGDGRVPYDNVVQLMVLLQRAGVPSVGLMTDSPE